MTGKPITAWRCAICGYIHRGATPPEWCPVCGSPRVMFEPYFGEAPAAAAPKAAGVRCTNCGFTQTDLEAPAKCPVCGAAADRFEPLAPAGAVSRTDRAFKVVVAGAGIAGVSAVEAVRAASKKARITLVAREPDLPYYRLNLTRLIAGEADEASLPLHPREWYSQERIDLALGVEVAALDLEGSSVTLSDGRVLKFDRLIIAAGAHPFMPPIAGMDRDNVTSLRTLGDARRILAAARPGARCVAIGGGILGLETAGGLARRGVDVALLEGHGWLLPRQLNERAGRLLERLVARLGVKVRHEARTKEIVGDDRAHGVLLEDGETLPADFVVVTTGIRPNSYLARVAGLQINQGILVDNRLATSHPNVYAAGDVAEHAGVVYGLWLPAQYEGQIAGMNAVGVVTEFGGIPRANTLKVLGIELFSIGVFEPPDASYYVADLERDEQYFRFVFRDNYLVGAILLGDAALTAAVKHAIETKLNLSDIITRHAPAATIMDSLRNMTV